MPGGRLTAALPPDSALSSTGQRLRDEINQLADAALVETPEQHAQRVHDLYTLWDTAERGFERALAHAQAANLANEGSGLSVRGLAKVLGVNASSLQDRVRKGKEQIAKLGPRRGRASA